MFFFSIYLIFKKRKELIEILLKHNPKINKKDENGNTPLHIACQNGNEDSVKKLLEKQKSLNHINVWK